MELRRGHAALASASNTLIGLGLFVGGVAVVVALVVPQLLGTHCRSRTPHCDNVYVALNGEVANELDAATHGSTTACDTYGDSAAVIECTLSKHTREDNPKNASLPAYVYLSEDHPLEPCQVGLSPAGTNGVRFHQYVEPGATASRSFSVVID